MCVVLIIFNFHLYNKFFYQAFNQVIRIDVITIIIDLIYF